MEPSDVLVHVDQMLLIGSTHVPKYYYESFWTSISALANIRVQMNKNML